MFSKKQWICAAVFVQSLSAIAQVSINNDNAAPHASAMLDVKSTNKGMLVPRMTTAQRNNIAAPATGLFVFDSDLNRFYFFNGTNWGEIGAITPKFIADADGNTSVHTETNSNEDVIRFSLGGNEKWRMVGERLESNHISNIFLGYNAGLGNTTGATNTFIGGASGTYNTTGATNTFIGYGSGYENRTGSFNTFLGSSAGGSNRTGNNNTFLGYGAGYLNTTGSDNIFLGMYAGHYNTTGDKSTFVGFGAGQSNTTGFYNTFLGNQSGRLNTTGHANTFLGNSSGYSNTTGDDNTFLGDAAGNSNTSGNTNTFIGSSSGKYNTIGELNTFVGQGSGHLNTTGSNNVYVGTQSGSYNTTGSQNIFVGTYAGTFNTIGNRNVFLGFGTGRMNTTGNSNTFLGSYTGAFNTTGYSNTFLGYESGNWNTTGNANTFLGIASGYSNTTGEHNVFLGNETGRGNTVGTLNTFVGDGSGLNNTTGSGNTFVGLQAGSSSNYNFCVAIGSGAQVTQDNQIRLGQSSISSAQIPVSWTVTSDARFKKDIESNVAGLSFIRLLRPVTYHYDMAGLARHLREDERMDTATKTMKRVEPDAFIRASREAKSKILQTGFLAQEVEMASKSIGYDFSGVDKPQNEGGVYGLRYAEFTVPLVKAVQELDAENRQLKADVAVLKQQVAQLLKSVPTK
jgi:trimeric autotransporter adhesin